MHQDDESADDTSVTDTIEPDISETNAVATRIACPFCGLDELHSLGVLPGSDRISRRVVAARFHCLVCGFEFVDPVLGAEHLADLYPDYYYSGGERPGLAARAFARFERVLHDSRARVALRHVRATSSANASLRAVDIGAGNGKFLAALARRGVQVTGCETSLGGCQRARAEQGIELFHGTLEEAIERGALAPASAELVTCWHVLEHVRDFAGLVRQMAELLAPGGILCLAVPNGGGYLARTGDAWAFYDHPRHLYTFREEHLRALAEAEGLTVEHVTSRSLEYEVPISILTAFNLFGSRRMWLYDLLKRDRKMRAGELLRALPSLLLGTCAIPLVAGLSLAGSLARRGNNLLMVARA